MVACVEGVRLADDIIDEKTAFRDRLEPGPFSSLHDDLSTGTDSNSTPSTANCSTAPSAIISTCLRARSSTHSSDPGNSPTRQSATQPQLVDR